MLPGSTRYTADYYEAVARKAATSARAILPWMLELAAPGSVIDVGCGTGAWLSVCRELGVEDVRGYDGGWVPLDDLRFPHERFVCVDLAGPAAESARADLAICLEVAEHLPAEAADHLIARLAGHASCVLFSASVPGQRGDHHVNEQWPAYWAERFARHGLHACDIVRPRFWEDPQVAWWYAQNAILYVGDDARLPDHAADQLAPTRTTVPRSLVHPGMLAAVEAACVEEIERQRAGTGNLVHLLGARLRQTRMIRR
ncbi:MAG: methyltransferase domain-containing protein [Solirubrobacteraceae bacterium]